MQLHAWPCKAADDGCAPTCADAMPTDTLSHTLPNMATVPVADFCPVYAPFFGAMGCTAAIVFTCIGAA